MYKVSPWVRIEGGAYRALAGKDGNDIANRVAFIEKTPRVRIREDYMGVHRHYDDLGNLTGVDRQWPEFLNWCEGYKGDGPDDEDSRAWCDRMLLALGYKLED